MAEHTDWQTEATVTGGLHLRKSEVLRSLRHYLQAQSQGHHTIDHLEERGIERGLLGNLPWKGKKRPLSVRQTLELLPRRCWEKFWEMGWSACGHFWVYRYHLELKGSVLNSRVITSLIIIHVLLCRSYECDIEYIPALNISPKYNSVCRTGWAHACFVVIKQKKLDLFRFFFWHSYSHTYTKGKGEGERIFALCTLNLCCQYM